ncbi:MAG TPA: hypothetical protein VF184_00470 [Phycisphaeraceae bacterium]
MSGLKQASMRAGVARSDITTEDPSVRVHDRLYAKVLALDDGKTRILIISMDAVAMGGIGDIPDTFLPELRRCIQQEFSIDGDHVLVHATHTHPPGRILCEEEELIQRTLDAVRQALERMTPVRVGAGRGREDRILINRTLRLKDGRGWTIRQAHPCPPDDLIADLGPVDPEIGILRIDRLDGRPLAVVYNYACHPLIGVPGGAVTANYPGFASQLIEEQLSDGAMALFLQGAAGDITEVLYKDVNRPRDSQSIGTMLGLSTLKALRNIQTQDAQLNIISQTVEFPRRTDIPQRIEALLQEQARLLESLRFTSLNFKAFLPLYLKYALHPRYPSDYAYRYLHAQHIGADDLHAMDQENRRNLEKYLNNIAAMERLAKIQDDVETLRHHQAINEQAGGRPVPAQVQGIRIGDFVLVTAPVEVLAEVGLRIKRNSPHPYTFLAAFSNGYMHYGPPAADYELGGYETTECFLAPQWESIYEETVRDILQRL